MGEITVARSGPEHMETLVDLHEKLNREMAEFSLVCPPEALERGVIEKLVHRLCLREDYLVWLARDETGPVGFISAAVLDSPLAALDYRVGTIANLYVLPEYRRRGVGNRLVDTALAALKAEGARHVELSYMFRNANGARFWQARGFRPESVKAVLLWEPDASDFRKNQRGVT